MRAWLLLAHAGPVIALTVVQYYLRSLSGPDDGANIGAGIALIPFIPLGLPWSLPFVIDLLFFPFMPITNYHWPYPRWTLIVDDLTSIGPAYINLLLHGLLVRRSKRRRSRHPQEV